MTKTIQEPSREIPVIGEYDVVVCGGGPAGTAAAIAAARQGLKTLIVEGQGQLGGMGTSGLVSDWLGGRKKDGTWVVGGIFREMSEEAAQAGIAVLPRAEPGQKYTPHGWNLNLSHGVPFDPFAMAAYHDRKLQAEKVDFLLLTQMVDVKREADRITHVFIHNKSGLQAVAAQAVIDATGDADVAARAGCNYDKGREEDGATAPASLEVHVDNVDQDVLSEYIHEHDSPRFRELIKELRAHGEWPLSVDIFIAVQLTEPGTMMLNTIRLCGYDATDGASVTEGMVAGRAEIEALIKCLRRHFPGFENARIKAVAPLFGVRESRRIHAEYRLTVEDLMSEKEFTDVIGWSSYGWDLPDPSKPSYQPMHGKPKPAVTPIPYRIMVPKGINNLLCPGRSICSERDVLGPLRVMAPVMAMGEAAGTAAQEVVKDKVAFRDVDMPRLREQLRAAGALI